MAGVVSLRTVAGAVDGCPAQMNAYLNRVTGECWMVGEEEFRVIQRECERSGAWNEQDDLDREEMEGRMRDWQRESLRKARAVLTSDEWIDLPTMNEFDEYEAMERFCGMVEEGRVGERLLRAIEGRGAFRRFKDAVRREGVEERWYGYRQGRLEEFVGGWLESEGIAYGK